MKSKARKWLDKAWKRFDRSRFYFERRIRRYVDIEEYIGIRYSQLEELFEKCGRMSPLFERLPVEKEVRYSWVGGQCFEGKVYGIPNGERKCLQIEGDLGKIRLFGDLSVEEFKWTGGGIYRGYLYAFPRKANKLLKIDVHNHVTEQVDIGIQYQGEHHYGGVLTSEGMIYQPPRNTDHILAINCKNHMSYIIPLYPQWTKTKARYCGSIQHPNGLIYFFPEKNERVICFNPKTEHFSFIGDYLDCMCFGAVVYSDGNIYGFSAYSKGILKIDPEQRKTEMIHQEIEPKCYGTQLGINGKLYGIPGDGDEFWEFDPRYDEIRSVAKTDQQGLCAKCAGGAVDMFGNIYCIPAFGNTVYKVSFNNRNSISDGLYKEFFTNNY